MSNQKRPEQDKERKAKTDRSFERKLIEQKQQQKRRATSKLGEK